MLLHTTEIKWPLTHEWLRKARTLIDEGKEIYICCTFSWDKACGRFMDETNASCTMFPPRLALYWILKSEGIQTNGTGFDTYDDECSLPEHFQISPEASPRERRLAFLDLLLALPEVGQPEASQKT